MSTDSSDRIHRYRTGEIPLLRSIAERLEFRNILARFIKPHGNETVPAVDSLMLLIFNIAGGRQPLYELEDWVQQHDQRSFGLPPCPLGTFNDDRFGKALDKLFLTDRASLMTELVVHMIKAFDLDLSRVHNDSTTVKAFGRYLGKTQTGFFLTQGHSKEHRPDLKQLIYTLTITADGGVPIHHHVYPGNRTDDTTHIETWSTLRLFTERSDFLYVADSKVCTHKQLYWIVREGGRVVTIVPETWGEVQYFHKQLRTITKAKKVLYRREIPGHEGRYETFSSFLGNYSTKTGHYKIHWIHSTEKKKRDRQAREESLQKAECELSELMRKLNAGKFKTKKQIREKVTKILKEGGVERFYRIQLVRYLQKIIIQVSRGRPGPSTQFRTTTKTIYSLSWARDSIALKKEKKADGVFPLLSTDDTLDTKDVLMAYKYQPRLEKRFCQFRNLHQAAPLLFKKLQRVEAIMFPFFMGLILQSVIEREVRLKMKEGDIDSLPIYPEHRIAHHPTTAKIFDRFENVSIYHLKKGRQTIKEYRDSLTPLQKTILGLLDIPEEEYWSERPGGASKG